MCDFKYGGGVILVSFMFYVFVLFYVLCFYFAFLVFYTKLHHFKQHLTYILLFYLDWFCSNVSSPLCCCEDSYIQDSFSPTFFSHATKAHLLGILKIQAHNFWRERMFPCSHFAICWSPKIFNEIDLGFLFVGHAHEYIDHVFSTVSRELKRRDVETMDDLIRRYNR